MMKKLMFYLTALFLLITPFIHTEASNNTSEKKFSVMTYNVHEMCLDINPEYKSIFAWIKNPRFPYYLNPNILGLQEAFRRDLWDYVMYEKKFYSHGLYQLGQCSILGLIEQGSGLTTFTDFNIIEARNITWKTCWGVHKYNWDCKALKGFQYCKIEIPVGDVSYIIAICIIDIPVDCEVLIRVVVGCGAVQCYVPCYWRSVAGLEDTIVA